jgi:hypothetical protein
LSNILNFIKKKGTVYDTKNIECHRIVKSYDGKSIQIAGLNFGNIQLGKLGIEPKLIQAASQALLILDASQYDLCSSIQNLTSEEERQQYVKRMIEDKLQSQKIYRALAALSLNPQGDEMQQAVKTLVSNLLDSQQRTQELEGSQVLSKVQQREHSQANITKELPESSIEVGFQTFGEKIEEVNKSQSVLNNTVPNRTVPEKPFKSKASPLTDEQTKKEMDEIKQVIVALNDEYIDNKIEGQLDVESFWRKLGRVIQELTENRKYREIIGRVNTDILDRNVIKITNKLKVYREANAIEDEIRAKVAHNETELYIGQIFRILDDIYLSLQ